MICREIMEVIEQRYPKKYALEWDNVGLQAGRSDKEVRKIYIALDATDEVIDEALRWGADLLLTHHPLIFKPLKQVNDQSFIGRRILRMIRGDMSYYSMHTNYDVMGMADLAGEFLDMEEPEVLEVTCVEQDGTENMREQGIGRVANLKKPMTVKECCVFVKERFALPSVKVFGEPEMMVNRIAVSPGSGKSVIGAALKKGADLLITGDIDHHEGIDAVAQKMAVMDAGHYGIEHIYIEDMRKFCEEHFPQIEVKAAQIQHPFWVM